jgi:hypothetical protein
VRLILPIAVLAAAAGARVAAQGTPCPEFQVNTSTGATHVVLDVFGYFKR